MKFHNRCRTPIQRVARKLLRVDARGLRMVRCIRDLSHLDADELRLFTQRNYIIERIAEAFDAAHTDAQLLAAIELAHSLTSLADDGSVPRLAAGHA